MDPFEAYKLYNALLLHFKQDGYNALKYNFKTTVTPKSFFARKDKFFFAKLGKNYPKEIKHYMVANFIKDNNYIADMHSLEGEKNYLEWKKIRESITRVFQTDINKIVLMMEEENISYDDLFLSHNNQHPLVIQLWIREELHLETIVILNDILGFMDREGKKITETIMWPDIYRKVTKYAPFVEFNRDKMVNIMKKSFTK